MKAKPGHLFYIDGLRCCLALYVVMHHIFRTVSSQPGVDVTPFCGWLRFGRLAVDGFIVVSGYCLMLPVIGAGGVLRRGVISFYVGRCRRILPAFFAAVVICAMSGMLLLKNATGTPWDDCIPITFRGLAFNFALLSDVLQREKINYVFWSVALEWRIYLLFPMLVWLFRRFGAVPVTAIILLVTAAGASAVSSHEASRNNIGYIGLFVLGMAGAKFDWDVPKKHITWLTPGIVLASAAATVVLLLTLVKDSLLHNPLFDVLIAATTLACLGTCKTNEQSVVRKTLQWRLLAGVGGFSYSIYLIHAPVLQLAWQYFIHPMHLRPQAEFVSLTATAVPASLAVAYLFSLVFERPFMSPWLRSAVVAETRASTQSQLTGDAAVFVSASHR